MLVWLVENTVAAAALGLIVAVVCRLNRSRPALCHFLWLLVLVRLVAPPLPGIEFPTRGLRDGAWRFAESAWTRLAPGFLGTEGPHRSVSRRPAGEAPSDAAEDAAAPGAAWPRSGDGASSSAESERSPGLIFFEPEPLRRSSWTIPIAIWAVGALLALARESRRMIRVERLVRRSPIAPRELMRFVRRVGSRLGVRTPQVRLLPGLDSPFVWSLARPVLVWPMTDGVAKETRCRQGLVAHELAHLRRRDHWTAWVETLALLIHWWNPLLWFVRRRLRFHAELACDAWAVETYPAERRSYAEALIDAAERMSLRAPVPVPALGAVDNGRREFEERLAVIFRQAPGSSRPPVVPAVAAVLVAALTLLSWTSAGGPEGGRGTAPADWSLIDPSLADAIRTEIRHRRAERHLEAGDYAIAAALSGERLAENPDDARAWACAGRAELGLGRPREAIAAFTRQIALGHDVAEAEFRTAGAYAKDGEPRLAAEAVQRAVDKGFRSHERILKDDLLDPLREDPDTDAALAEAVARAKENASFSAEASCTTLGPGETWPNEKDPKAYHAHASRLLADGRVDEALEALRRLVRLGWNVPVALADIACCHARLGDDSAALDYLHRAVDAGFEDAERLWRDESLRSLQGDPRLDRIVYRATDAATLTRFKAVDWASLRKRSEERLAKAPDDGMELHRYGCAMLQLGDRDRAVEAFRRQYAAGHLKANAAYNVACCYALENERAAAIDWLEKSEAEGLKPGAVPLRAKTLLEDPDLDALRGDPRFEAMIERLRGA